MVDSLITKQVSYRNCVSHEREVYTKESIRAQMPYIKGEFEGKQAFDLGQVIQLIYPNAYSDVSRLTVNMSMD